MSSSIEAGARKIDTYWIPVIWADDLKGRRVLWENGKTKFDDREDAARFAIDTLAEYIVSGQLRFIPKP